MNSPLDLHDATLRTLTFDWRCALLAILLRAGVADSDHVVLEAHSVDDLKFPRMEPWGPSNSINSVALSSVGEGQLLAIEMQSGDLLEVRCHKVTVKRGSQEAVVLEPQHPD
jgi:hypothetical protein